MRRTVKVVAAACAALLAAASFAPAAQAGCKTGLTNHYENHFFVAEVVTNWCYSRGNVISRKSIPRAYVKTFAGPLGWKEGPMDVAYTGCHTVNGYPKHNCLTRFQFSFYNIAATSKLKVGVCVHTRIYGNGAHNRALSTNC